MVSLTFVFWMFVVIFAVIGAMRGWAKELLVTFAVILALFILAVLEKYVGFFQKSLTGEVLFWFRIIMMGILVFFGYQGPNIPKLQGPGRFARDKLQDALLGVFLGAINGYMIFGSAWSFLAEAKYPLALITAPDPYSPIGQAAIQLLTMMVPHWLVIPYVYFAIALAFAFVLVVFI